MPSRGSATPSGTTTGTTAGATAGTPAGATTGRPPAPDAAARDRWLARADERLTGAGLRAGAARTAVIEYLARAGQCLLSAQEITDGLRADGGASAASVYRVLDQLHELGLIHRVDGGDGVARYEIADPERHHHHIVEEASGTVRPFSDDDLEAAISAAAARAGIRLTGHDVILRGVPLDG